MGRNAQRRRKTKAVRAVAAWRARHPKGAITQEEKMRLENLREEAGLRHPKEEA